MEKVERRTGQKALGGREVYFEKIERKQFKYQPTISKVAFNNLHNKAMVLDRDHREWQMQRERGGERDKSSKRDVRKVATGNNTTRRQQYSIKKQ